MKLTIADLARALPDEAIPFIHEPDSGFDVVKVPWPRIIPRAEGMSAHQYGCPCGHVFTLEAAALHIRNAPNSHVPSLDPQDFNIVCPACGGHIRQEDLND